MNAAELIAFLKTVPPETPVVRFLAFGGHDSYEPVKAKTDMMYRTVQGDYGKFRAEKLQDRNQVQTVQIY